MPVSSSAGGTGGGAPPSGTSSTSTTPSGCGTPAPGAGSRAAARTGRRPPSGLGGPTSVAHLHCPAISVCPGSVSGLPLEHCLHLHVRTAGVAIRHSPGIREWATWVPLQALHSHSFILARCGARRPACLGGRNNVPTGSGGTIGASDSPGTGGRSSPGTVVLTESLLRRAGAGAGGLQGP